VVADPRAEHSARQTEATTYNDGNPGNRRLFDGSAGAQYCSKGAVALCLGPRHGTGLVDEVNNGQMKGIAQIDESLHFLGGSTCEGTAHDGRIVDHYPDRIAI